MEIEESSSITHKWQEDCYAIKEAANDTICEEVKAAVPGLQ